MNNKNTYRNVIITSIITVILITSGVSMAYADGVFPGKNKFGSTTNVASGYQSAAFGFDTTASGEYATTFGVYTTSNGHYTTTFGYDTTASGPSSTAFGRLTTANGHYTTAFGHATTAQPYTSFVIGQYNEISGTANSWIATDPLFVIGNGVNADDPNNAVTVLKNGNVGIGTSSPSEALDITGNTHVTGNSIIDGNVGIGTTTPNSELQVSGYIQLDTSSGKPSSTDCVNADDIGRMKVDDTVGRFYICADGPEGKVTMPPSPSIISWKTGALR